MRTLIILFFVMVFPSVTLAQGVALGAAGNAIRLGGNKPQGYISDKEVRLGEIIDNGSENYFIWASAHVREDEDDYLIVVAGYKEYVETPKGSYFRIHPEFTFKVKEGGMFSVPIKPVNNGLGVTMFPSTYKVVRVDTLSTLLEKYHSSLVKPK